MKRITAQQAFEAQETLDAAKLGVTDHYPPTLKQITEAERIIRQHEAETGKRSGEQSYHVIQETKSGRRVLEHTRKLKPAVLRALQCKRAFVTSDTQAGPCEEVFRVSESVYSGIATAVRIAEEAEAETR